MVTQDAGLLVSGRAVRAECWLHLHDQQARHANAARRTPKPGQRARAAGADTAPRYGGWRRVIVAASTRPTMRPPNRWSRSPSGSGSGRCSWATPRASPIGMWVGCRICGCGSGAAPTCCKPCVTRLSRQASGCGWWTSAAAPQPAPACRRRVPKPKGRRFGCPHCGFHGHRDLVGAHNIAAKAGGRHTSTAVAVLVEHRRAGILPARRDRRRHQYDLRRHRSYPAPGHPAATAAAGCRSSGANSHPVPGEDQAAPPNRANVA
jgi:putative transposase